MPPNPKLHRWFDLLAALLRRRYPISFNELARDVPDYAHDDSPSDTLMRMFERDKDELRRLGIAIETVSTDDGETLDYRLRAESFYLPYLVLAGVDRPGVEVPAAPGYRRLPSLAILPEDAALLRRAAERVRTLGEPQLMQDADRALRKLRYDLPDELPPNDSAPTSHDRTSYFATLVDAVQRRKRATFAYHSIGRGDTETRSVQPLGLVYLTGHWYLVAFDEPAQQRRIFRTSRMQAVQVNTKSPGSADFDVPSDFDLRAYARSRQAWELGDGATETIDIRFTRHAPDLAQAERIAEVVHDDGIALILRFGVRRRDTFLRWVLAYGGNAVPVSPDAVVQDWNQLLQATFAVHAEAAAELARERQHDNNARSA